MALSCLVSAVCGGGQAITLALGSIAEAQGVETPDADGGVASEVAQASTPPPLIEASSTDSGPDGAQLLQQRLASDWAKQLRRSGYFFVSPPSPIHRRIVTPVAIGSSDVDCLTEAVYFEARGEPVRGQSAVAQVVLNRVRDPHFPKTVCDVVFQGHEHRGCQFSFTCDGSINRGVLNLTAWQRSRKIAEQAISGPGLPEVGTATHYHADYVSPNWSNLQRIAKIGAHIFYTWGRRSGLVHTAGPGEPSNG